MLGFFIYLRVAAWKAIATQCQRFCEAENINHLFQHIWKCHSSSGSVVWTTLAMPGMQREGNCPLNACAFAKLKLLTIFFRVYLEMPFFQWICGLDDSGIYAAGRQLPTQCLRSCFRCCQGSHCLLNGRAFAS